jgi:hypothetical protein
MASSDFLWSLSIGFYRAPNAALHARASSHVVCSNLLGGNHTPNTVNTLVEKLGK